MNTMCGLCYKNVFSVLLSWVNHTVLWAAFCLWKELLQKVIHLYITVILLCCVESVNTKVIAQKPVTFFFWKLVEPFRIFNPALFLHFSFSHLSGVNLSVTQFLSDFHSFIVLTAVSPSCGRWAWFWRVAQRRCVPPLLWSCAHPATRASPRPLWAQAHNPTTESSLKTRSPSSTASSSF